MADIITVIGVWLFSLMAAFASVRQPKGVDWYAPISNKKKMVMTFANISILLIVILFLLLIISIQLWQIAVISVVCIIIVLFLCFKKTDKSDNGNNGNNYDTNLLDNICKLLTVFNSVFAVLNVAYMMYVYFVYDIKEIIAESHITTVQAIFSMDNALVVHGTILFWSALTMSVVTAKNWNIKEENNNGTSRKITCTAKYYAKRITNRNRT